MNGRIAKLTLAIMGCVKKQEENEMKNNKSISLPLPAHEGGTKTITQTPVIGTPRREYAEMFVPGEEPPAAALIPFD